MVAAVSTGTAATCIFSEETVRGHGVPTGRREPGLLDQTVVVIGGSTGIELETARRAPTEGAEVILTGRNPSACGVPRSNWVR